MVKGKNQIKKWLSVFGYGLTNPIALLNIYRVKRNRLTYLSYSKLVSLSRYFQKLRRRKINGMLIEAGCALGGSAIILSLLKEKNRKFHIYDTFTQIPPPTSKDEQDAFERYQVIHGGKAKGIKDDRYYGYEENLIEKVEQNFRRFNLPLKENNIAFHQGFFRDKLNISETVAFAHIDSDWYDSIFITLDRIVPHLAVGGFLVIDDYYDWRGAKKATDDFFSGKEEHFEFIVGPQLAIRKISRSYFV